MDESASYTNLPINRDLVNPMVGDYFSDHIFHFWWLDKNLLKIFKDVDLDHVL